MQADVGWHLGTCRIEGEGAKVLVAIGMLGQGAAAGETSAGGNDPEGRTEGLGQLALPGALSALERFARPAQQCHSLDALRREGDEC